MKITIDTDVLQEKNLTFQQFLVLLIAYKNIDYKKIMDNLVESGIALKDIYNPYNLVLSDNTRNGIMRILIDCDKNVANSNIDFETIAVKMRDLYPKGYKPGTTYLWRDSVAVIVGKLKTLVSKYNFYFTEEEAIAATKEYLDTYKHDNKFMKLLRYFILKTDNDGVGNKRIKSDFMTIIENNRQRKEEDENETDN